VQLLSSEIGLTRYYVYLVERDDRNCWTCSRLRRNDQAISLILLQRTGHIATLQAKQGAIRSSLQSDTAFTLDSTYSVVRIRIGN